MVESIFMSLMYGWELLFGGGEPDVPVVCDNVPGLIGDFQAERYMGRWYEIYHTMG